VAGLACVHAYDFFSNHVSKRESERGRSELGEHMQPKCMPPPRPGQALDTCTSCTTSLPSSYPTHLPHLSPPLFGHTHGKGLCISSVFCYSCTRGQRLSTVLCIPISLPCMTWKPCTDPVRGPPMATVRVTLGTSTVDTPPSRAADPGRRSWNAQRVHEPQ
jgi:hypothetical protein